MALTVILFKTTRSQLL